MHTQPASQCQLHSCHYIDLNWMGISFPLVQFFVLLLTTEDWTIRSGHGGLLFEKHLTENEKFTKRVVLSLVLNEFGFQEAN